MTFYLATDSLLFYQSIGSVLNFVSMADTIFITSYLSLFHATAVVLLGALGRFLISLYKARRMIIKLKNQGLVNSVDCMS